MRHHHLLRSGAPLAHSRVIFSGKILSAITFERSERKRTERERDRQTVPFGVGTMELEKEEKS